MTYQEAINVMQKYTGDDTISPVVQEAHVMAIDALEKARCWDEDQKIDKRVWDYMMQKVKDSGLAEKLKEVDTQ